MICLHEEVSDIGLSFYEMEDLSSLEFFERGFSLTEDDTLDYYDIDYSIWVNFLCRLFDDWDVETINLIQASQTGKTSFQMGILKYISKYLQGGVPVLWVQSTESQAVGFIQDRLKPFMDKNIDESIKNGRWKQEFFRVGKAAVKVAYSTTRETYVERPARIVIGDEVVKWGRGKLTPIEVLYLTKKRSRTFKGKRKHLYSTIPPYNREDPIWIEFTENSDFYQWWCPCPNCKEEHPLLFKDLRFKEAKINGKWDIGKIKQFVRYSCPHCSFEWKDEEKRKIILNGRAVCVDANTYERKDPVIKTSVTLQISAMYSNFTDFSYLAEEFIKAKKSGWDALKTFFTDELAEPPPQQSDNEIKFSTLKSYIDEELNQGELPRKTSIITAGIDVQRSGEMYFSVVAWSPGAYPSAHLVDCGIVSWLDDKGQPNFEYIKSAMQKYLSLGIPIENIVLDGTDGVVLDILYAFTTKIGRPWMVLREQNKQKIKVKFSHLSDEKQRKSGLKRQNIMNVNSHMVKNYIEQSLLFKEENRWSFFNSCPDDFFYHCNNEHRVSEKRGGRVVEVWKPKYSKAPQHYFSSYVYAICCRFNPRVERYLVEREVKTIRREDKNVNVANIGVNDWLSRQTENW